MLNLINNHILWMSHSLYKLFGVKCILCHIQICNRLWTHNTLLRLSILFLGLTTDSRSIFSIYHTYLWNDNDYVTIIHFSVKVNGWLEHAFTIRIYLTWNHITHHIIIILSATDLQLLWESLRAIYNNIMLL